MGRRSRAAARSRSLRPDAPPLRAIGQIVSRAAAERLLDRTLPFDRPVDTLLQMTWVTGQPVLVASPSPVRDVSRETGGTTVQRRSMGLAERLRHEAMRPIYRAQVLARYRRHMARRIERCRRPPALGQTTAAPISFRAAAALIGWPKAAPCANWQPSWASSTASDSVSAPSEMTSIPISCAMATIERRIGERAPNELGLTREASIRIASKRYCGRWPSEV